MGQKKENKTPYEPLRNKIKYWKASLSILKQLELLLNEYLEHGKKLIKMLNEMIFRGYYGSVDAAEFKGSLIAESKELTNWVPYDYM